MVSQVDEMIERLCFASTEEQLNFQIQRAQAWATENPEHRRLFEVQQALEGAVTASETYRLERGQIEGILDVDRDQHG
jgi:hypothetical protein